LKQDNSSGYQALILGAALVDPVWTGRLLLTGADRLAYLQGLITNDIGALTPGTGCYAAMLNAQGRMLTDLHVFELGDSVLLTLPASVTPSIREHLDRFIFAEDVAVQDVSASLAQIGVYGPRAEAVVTVARSRSGAVVVSSDEAAVQGFDVFVDAASAAAVREALANAGAVPASAADVETVRVEHGRPRWGAEMDTDTIPLEAGIEDRAISRTKGCYVGQEVIVRVLDRGHGRVARRLVGLTFDQSAPVPAEGAEIVSGPSAKVGRITSAVRSPALARPIALGYVHRDFVEPGTPVHVAGAPAAVAALPFRP
jgi:folate-binding protein YgfZ